MICTECGIGEVVEEDLGVEIKMVCHNCGCVSNENLCDSFVSAKNPNYEQTSFGKKYRAGGRVDPEGGRYIYAYCNEMNACIDKYSNDNEAIKKTAKDLYIRMYNDGFLHKNKTRLAAACVYLALQESDIPISIHSIASCMGSPVNKMLKVISRIKSSIGGRVNPDTALQVKLALEGLPCMKNRGDLEQKAMELFSLFEQFSLTSGRSPSTLAVACSYFAYNASQKKMARGITMRNYCKNNGAPYQSCQHLISVAKQRLILLMKRIPWIKNFSALQYHMYIDDVLRYKDILFSSYEETQPSTSVQALRAPPTLFRDIKSRAAPSDQWMPEASTSEIICEDDIPEAEIDMYVRTSDEVSKKEKIQKLLQSKTE